MVIDSLAVQITSSIKGQNKLNAFGQALERLATTSKSINTSNLSKTATDVSTLSSALSGISKTKVGNIATLTTNLKQLSKVNFSSSGINGFANALSGFNNVNTNGIKNLSNSLTRLATAFQGGFSSGSFAGFSTSIAGLATSLSGINDIDSKVTRLIGGLARLASAGSSIGTVTAYLPTLGNQIVKLVTDVQGVGVIDVNMTRLVEGIAKLASAGKKIGVTVANLDSLGNGVLALLQKLNNAPAINANIAQTVQGLGNLASSGSRIGVVSGNTGRSLNIFKGILGRITSNIGNTTKATKGLASAFGMLYAKFWLFIRAGKALLGSVGSAQDYIESFNYFAVAMDKIGSDVKDQWQEAGYSSAEAYAQSFRSRFDKLKKQMTGYDVDRNSGTLDFQAGVKNLGLDIGALTQYQAQVAQVTNSTGQLGEVSVVASKAMSMLAADWSSLANTDLQTTQENFMSALNGQSRAVYKYGVNLTVANLQQIAYNHGIQQSVSQMTGASKQQLRLLGMLEQSKVAYGDLARTINQPANQLRMLKAGFHNLARTIGGLFVPMLQKVYPYLNAMVMVLQEFFQWVSRIAGIKISDTSFKTPDYDDAVDDTDDIADNAKATEKATKKIADNLQGFDIINKLDDTSSDTSNPTGSGKSPLQDIDLSKDLETALKGYEKIWNKFFNSSENKAAQIAKRIKSALLSGWKKGDYTALGTALGTWINKGLSKINWGKIQKTAEKIGKSIATFLNGAVYGLDWDLLGTTIGNGINTAFTFAYSMVKNFDFLTFGKSVAKGLNSAIKTTDFSLIGKTLGSALRGVVQSAFGFVTNFDFKMLGTKISIGINSFLEDMGKVDKRTGLTGWQEMGQSLSKAITGFADTLIVAMNKVDWNKVGAGISDFLVNLNWPGILASLGTVLATAISSVIKAGISAFAKDPVGMTTSLTSLFGTIFAIKTLKSVVSGKATTNLTTIFSSLFGNTMDSAAEGAEIGKASTTLLGRFSKKLKGKGMSLAGLSVAVTGALVSIEWAKGQWKNIFDEYSEKEIQDALSEMFGSKNTQNAILKSLADSLAGIFTGIGAVFSGKYSLDEWINGLKELANKGLYGSNPSPTHRTKTMQKHGGGGGDWDDGSSKSKTSGGGSFGSATKAVNKYTNALNKSKSSVILFSNAQSKLLSNLNKSGISYKDYIGYITKLQNAYNSGKISISDYNKLTSRTYNNVKDFKKAVDGLLSKNGKSVNIKTSVSGKEEVDNVSKSINGVSDKTANITVKQTGADATKQAIDRISGKTVKMPVVAAGVQKTQNDINAIKGKNVKVNASLKSSTLSAKLSNKSLTDIKNQVNGIKANPVASPLKPKIQAFYMPKKQYDNVMKMFPSLGWHKEMTSSLFKSYSTGGFPEDGWFRANHGELMGTFDNGKSVVANNQQITEGFARGIASVLGPAIYQATKQALSESGINESGDTIIQLDGREIGRATINEINKQTRSKGRSPLVAY